jgi:hypothetical protein
VQLLEEKMYMRCVMVGEDNTQKLHAMVTKRYRRNCISRLIVDDGRQISDHDEMAGMLWASYKNRMGSSEGISMQFDLVILLKMVASLKELSMTFLVEEIELVIKQMSPDKPLG